MRTHPGRTLSVVVVIAAAMLGAIALVWDVAPEARPAVLAVGSVAYLILGVLLYVVERRRHW